MMLLPPHEKVLAKKLCMLVIDASIYKGIEVAMSALNSYLEQQRCENPKLRTEIIDHLKYEHSEILQNLIKKYPQSVSYSEVYKTNETSHGMTRSLFKKIGL